MHSDPQHDAYPVDYLPKTMGDQDYKDRMLSSSPTRERRWAEEIGIRAREIAESRLTFVGLAFFVIFFVVAIKMNLISFSAAPEGRVGISNGIIMQRSDILDRNGRVLAMNIDTHSLYAQPQQMIDPKAAVAGLIRVFPDLEKRRESLLNSFTDGKRKFLWIKKNISPEQRQAIHELGEPGLLFGPREMRLYPNGATAAHILGGASFGKEGVTAAEVIGVAGIEKKFDDYLRDPDLAGDPLKISIDLTIQTIIEELLAGGIELMDAKGASAVLMDVHTGEVVSMASLPDFDPNNRPRPLTSGDQSDSPLFNRAVQGVYELGSVYKILAAAQALDLDLVTPETIIDTSPPMRIGRYPIGEYRNKNYGKLSVADIIVNSSNRGTARMALEIGGERQQEFLRSLGMFEATPIEIVEAKGGKPLRPKKWGELSTVTISYGHGLSTTAVHLASAYAAIANGGYYVAPTLMLQDGPQYERRVMSEEAAVASQQILRKVVTDGTATFAEVAGYSVAGKTGTADKPKPTGGYYKDKVIATFASIFPATDPKYVLIVSLDEPEVNINNRDYRTAGWTAVPVAAEIIGRVAPLLGLAPQYEQFPD